MVMAIPMFIRIETLIMDPMDMKLITTTKSVLQSQDMDTEVTAMCTGQLKALPEDYGKRAAEPGYGYTSGVS